MSKAKEKKALVIDQLQERLTKSNIGIFTDYRGLSAAEINDLRGKLRELGVEYRVVKNTLARFAAERAGKSDLVGLLQGPVAVAFGHGDVIEPVKVLIDYARTVATGLNIKGGFLDDRVLTPGDVAALATLPAREVLLAQVVGGIQSPIVMLINCLTAPMRGIMGVLQARIQQMEGE